jgi:replicative DNA helicase
MQIRRLSVLLVEAQKRTLNKERAEFMQKGRLFDFHKDQPSQPRIKPQTQIEDLKPFLEEYLRQKGINPHKTFKCLSPCHEDIHPSMSFDRKLLRTHCFSCGINYDLFDLIGLDYKLPAFADQSTKAFELFGNRLPKHSIREDSRFQSEAALLSWRAEEGSEEKYLASADVRSEELLTASDGTMSAQDYLDGLETNSVPPEYFYKRGISLAVCHKYHFFQKGGYAYMPVFENGVCISWCARAVSGEASPRYLNSRGRMGIWNADVFWEAHGQEASPGTVFVTEGIINAVSLEEALISGNGETRLSFVSLCGSGNAAKFVSLFRENIDIFSRWNYIICGDPDGAGVRMNKYLCKNLKERGIKCLALNLEGFAGDINELLLKNPDRLKNLALDAASRVEGFPAPDAYEKASALQSAASVLDSFFEQVKKNKNIPTVSTGFTELDLALGGGLHSGLYVLGAVSSLGKTSFILQMADFISSQGQDVLFFSLEQSIKEMIARSISRFGALLSGCGAEAFSSRELLSGKISGKGSMRLVREAGEAYKKVAGRLFIKEVEGITDISQIKKAVESHMKSTGRKPVVMLDYIQILRASDKYMTDKQNIDSVITELKCFSRKFDFPLIAISSFNRSNYKNSVSMESFKESGSLEYSSDVLMGLQFAATGNKDFNINAEKLKNPRQVELLMIKNRDGLPYSKISFNYYAKYNLFVQKMHK